MSQSAILPIYAATCGLSQHTCIRFKANICNARACIIYINDQHETTNQCQTISIKSPTTKLLLSHKKAISQLACASPVLPFDASKLQLSNKLTRVSRLIAVHLSGNYYFDLWTINSTQSCTTDRRSQYQTQRDCIMYRQPTNVKPTESIVVMSRTVVECRLRLCSAKNCCWLAERRRC